MTKRAETSSASLAILERWFPERGPCAFCGHPDARHRLWDMLIASPDSDADVARAYEIPEAAVSLVRAERPYQDDAS